MLKSILSILPLIVLLIGCTTQKDQKEDPLLKEAFVIHQKSVEAYKSLVLHKDSLEILYSFPTNKADSILTARLDSQVLAWAEAFSEVPGFEDYQNHHPDHQHGPSLIKDLPSEEILQNQKSHAEALDSLFEIVNQLKSRYLSEIFMEGEPKEILLSPNQQKKK